MITASTIAAAVPLMRPSIANGKTCLALAGWLFEMA